MALLTAPANSPDGLGRLAYKAGLQAGGCKAGRGTMVAVDPLLLLLFLLKAVLGYSVAAAAIAGYAQIVPGTGERQNGIGGGVCPFKSVFLVLFPFSFPILLPQPAKVVGAVRAQELQ